MSGQIFGLGLVQLPVFNSTGVAAANVTFDDSVTNINVDDVQEAIENIHSRAATAATDITDLETRVGDLEAVGAVVQSVTNASAGAGKYGLVKGTAANPTILPLVAGTNMTFTDNGTYLTADAAGGGGGGDLQDAYDAGNSISVTGGTPVQITAASALNQTYAEVLSSAGNPIWRAGNSSVGNTWPTMSIMSASAQTGGIFAFQVNENANALGTYDNVIGSGSATTANSTGGHILGRSNTITGVSSDTHIVGQSCTLDSCVGTVAIHSGNGGASTIYGLTGAVASGAGTHIRFLNGGGATGYPWSSSPGNTYYPNETTLITRNTFLASGATFTIASIPVLANTWVELYHEQHSMTDGAIQRYQYNRGRYFASNVAGGGASVSAVFDGFNYNPTTAVGSLSVDISSGNVRLRYAPGSLGGRVHGFVRYRIIRSN